MELTGKTAIVTGASRGIGAAVALQLAKAGTNVVLNARHQPPAQLLAEIAATGSQSLVYLAPIEDPTAAQGLIEATQAQFGRVDVLVNNAGITKDQLAVRMTPAAFAEVVEVNLIGTYNVTQPAFQVMNKARSGVIVNLASVVGQIGNIGQANYAASKAGIVGLTKTLAKEGGRRHIRVNAVAPGMIDTAMTQGLSDAIKAQMLATIPLRRFGTPQEVAEAVLFLIHNEYMNGQVLTIDGGLT
ncbi:3-oxoacyl-ACP reductase FabG [Lacticaseibacillus jixiensis]|uniref:3-oxoacyl-ACP reductase FabG n=1 Tax=Lacticaseibacillus jixiensis TaxID=3231926 RepID=UPI0036F1C60E